jgi:FERM C-terminal PH-like domain
MPKDWKCMGLIFIRPWFVIFFLNSTGKKVTFDLTQDDAGKEINLGVTSLGLVVFFNNIRINLFSWSKIIKISFKRKQFFISLRREPVRPFALN